MKIQLFTTPLDDEKIQTILTHMDYSPLLVPSSSPAKVEEICSDAFKFKIGRIVALELFHDEVLRRINGTDVQLVHGAGDLNNPNECLEACRIALEKGANEIDMMFRHSWFFDKKYDVLQNHIHNIASLAASYGRIIKVIIETGYLTDEEKILSSRLALEAGATFIKTNLGMRPGRANLHDLLLLKETFGDSIKLKASGSVASLEDAWAMWNAGAERFAMRENLVSQLHEIGYVAK